MEFINLEDEIALQQERFAFGALQEDEEGAKALLVGL